MNSKNQRGYPCYSKKTEGKYLSIEGGLFPTAKAENSRFSLKQGGLFRGGGAVPVDFYCIFRGKSENSPMGIFFSSFFDVNVLTYII